MKLGVKRCQSQVSSVRVKSQVSEGTDTLHGGHRLREGHVESTAEAPINGKIRSQHSLQPNPLALLLLHDHTSKA